ncbi:3-hydroxyacyl-CoA dehydrogenase family protein [Pseudomonas lini]
MMLLLEEGARPEQIDRVMVEFGYPMGPFAVSDLSGLDVSYDTRKRRAAADPQYRKLHVPDRMVELGRKGQKKMGPDGIAMKKVAAHLVTMKK